MAAPTEDSGSVEEEENDEEIDVLSPNFNPLKALYASNVSLPVVDASVFNNLAEYERFMSKAEKETTAAQEQKSAPMSRRALERRHLEHLREKEKELPRSTYHQKKMFQLNVLSRMESDHTKESPLDLLRQCVEKRCKVRVCVRSFKGIRSICIGYLVAFDKIWNMALSDVVEIYKRPSTGKRFHHEEKVTYSMIMSNLNPQPKKPEPPKPSEQEQKVAVGKKRAKECKFCRIKHEALMEQQAARDSRDTESSQSWSDSESSGSETDEYSTSEESTSDLEKEMGNVKSERARRKQKTPKKPSGLHVCPNGHERPRSQSGRPSTNPADIRTSKKDESATTASTEITSNTTTSSVAKRVTLEASDSLWTLTSGSGPNLPRRTMDSAKKEGASVEKSSVSTTTASSKESKTSSAKAKSSSSSTSSLSAARKSDLLLSRMTTSSMKLESVSSAVTDNLAILTHTRSSATMASSRTSTTPSSSSLSQTFSKSLTIQKKSMELSDMKSKDEKETKTVKEEVHLDPETGRRLIQPEEFKRRHVNQLFIRGDQVVLVSVDSEMVEVDLK